MTQVFTTNKSYKFLFLILNLAKLKPLKKFFNILWYWTLLPQYIEEMFFKV